MAVHKPKFKNIPLSAIDRIIKHHIPYELSMMRLSLAAALERGPNQFQQNLYVEGFALHCRNLIEFLKNGDACAFNPTDFTNTSFKVDKKFIRTKLIDKINEQISHLTDGRTEDQDEKFKPSDWQETADIIESEFSRWLQNLTPEWAEKWEQRERMGADVAETIVVEAGAGGACSAPTFVTVRSGDT
ncbi:hypothetical protein [Bradyrhizobium liaoningense]|uniref:hypothetical protein n=1 Tax=Bradyrhizobium liaoningense TaxID=43992 RepID=UPI001BACBD4D|nr:hypothetical protein [Bradyrhizobium liaoningense]MBR0985349.1 hypothetical protein [Bradyrhizobium liaoningense]